MAELVGTVAGSAGPPTVVDDRPMAFGFLLGYLDLAFRGIQEYERYRDLVFGPWIELERPNQPLGLRQWTRSVEVQRTAHPPLALGSLRVRMDFRERRRKRRAPSEDAPRRRAPVKVELRVGVPRIAMFVETEDEAKTERLEVIAREVAERFRRQLD